MTTLRIPHVDIGPLSGGDTPSRRQADAAIAAAAADVGFLTIGGLAGHPSLGADARRALLRIFSLPDAEKRRLWRRKFAPENPNVYRGWFPLQDGFPTYKEGIDVGPDLVRPTTARADDPLLEATPLPPENTLPGWRAAAVAWYLACEALGRVLLRSLAGSLNLEEKQFDEPFTNGISTLRVIRYPVRPPRSFAGADPEALWTTQVGRRVALSGAPHVDSGFVTLLAQDGTDGLQVRAADGQWIDVPPDENRLVVNFGRLLERWTAGRVRATEHRVVAVDRERFSIPFFCEPRVDALIAPLPVAGAEPFEPFLYGDHLWSAVTAFVEFRGLENVRPPRGRIT